MKELKVGMYIRYIPTQGNYTQKISKITKTKNCMLDMAYYLDNSEEPVFSSHFDDIVGVSEYIIDLIEPMDLLFVDIDNGYEGGIIVPRIAETMSELNEIKEKIKSGNLKLKYIVTKEEIECRKYEVE